RRYHPTPPRFTYTTLFRSPVETVQPQVVPQASSAQVPVAVEAPIQPAQPAHPPQAVPSPIMPVEAHSTMPITLAEGEQLIRPTQPRPMVDSRPAQLGEAPTVITPQTARQAPAYDPDVGYMDDTAPDAGRYRQPLPNGDAISRLPADTPAVHGPDAEAMPGHLRRRDPTLRFNSHIDASEPAARTIMVSNV